MPRKKKESGGRSLYLDLLKCLAALLTVFYHFAYYRLDYGFCEGSVYAPNANRILMCFASCCVPLFFMVNGALMFAKERNWKDVYRKAVKIILLTIIWSLIGFPAWFFKTLTVLYLLFPLFQYLYRKRKGLYFALCALILVFPFLMNLGFLILRAAQVDFSVSLMGHTLAVSDLHTTGLFTMYGGLYFLLGPVLNKPETKVKAVFAGLIAFAGWTLVTAECVIYTNLENAMYDGVNAAFPTVGALLLSTGVFLLAKRLNLQKIGKPLAWLGSAMLPIYLMHMAVINLLKNNFEYNLNYVTAVVGSVLICLFCAVIGKLAEKIPGLCWLVRM